MNRSCLLLALGAAVACGQWVTLAPLPEARYSGAVVALGNRLYYLGGSAVGGVKTRSVFIYDTSANTWSIGDSMLTPRHRFGAAALNGRIHVFGGWGNSGVLLGSTEVYDTATRTWTFAETLRTRRAAMFAAAGNGRLYAIGGWTGTAALRTVEEFDPGTNTWTFRQPMPTARCEGATGVLNGLIVCVGGTSTGSNVLNVNEAYDPTADRWTTLAPIPTARCRAGAGTEGLKLYVYGGIDSTLTNTHACEGYYLLANAWTPWVPLPSSRRDLAGGQFENWHEVYAIGGQDSTMQPTGRVERLELPMSVEARPELTARARLAVHPNPGRGLLRLSFHDAAGPATIADASGRVVAVLRPCRGFALWDATRYRAGVYFCTLGNPALSAKLILQD